MEEFFTAIFNAPIATIFVVAGLLFLGIAVIGKISGKIEPGKGGRITSGVIGVILLGIGFAIYLKLIVPSPEPSGTPTPPPPTSIAENTPVTAESSPSTSTISPQVPKIYNFSACLERCTRSNATHAFPEATSKLYVQWDFENIPIGADYARVWSMDGQEWIRYQCTWPGPNTGTDTVSLKEPTGLHSGTWEVTITVNGMVLLREQIQVEGNWTFWDPAGTRNSCYDK
ncbi:MAG: hypothetical protein KAV87_60120 [Desulfobacteraceae bacterium]|nr:hypothetical protein [Desulfobacteraceae bacterium]